MLTVYIYDAYLTAKMKLCSLEAYILHEVLICDLAIRVRFTWVIGTHSNLDAHILVKSNDCFPMVNHK